MYSQILEAHQQRTIYLKHHIVNIVCYINQQKRCPYPNPWNLWMWSYLEKSTSQIKISRWDVQVCDYKRKVEGNLRYRQGEKAKWRARWGPRLKLSAKSPGTSKVVTTAEMLTESIIIKILIWGRKKEIVHVLLKGFHVPFLFLFFVF